MKSLGYYGKSLWNSPTFTTWGGQLTQALRFLAVTPLLITSFSEFEIAAWYLFGSLNLFGDIVTQRLGLTFSRMFSFAMAGSDDLSPITQSSSNKVNTSSSPNWELMLKLFSTLGSLKAISAVLTSAIAFLMGAYSLKNIAGGTPDELKIWIAFVVMLTTGTVATMFKGYWVALQGMNYVSLLNRWNIIFSLASIIIGFIALSLGAGIVMLAIAMQLFVPIQIVTTRYLLRKVEEGRFKGAKGYGWDRRILRWAWSPLWKGFISQVSNIGVLQLSGVILTKYGSVESVASYMFSLRLMTVITMTAQAPFTSQMPKFARLMASGSLKNLITQIQNRTCVSVMIMVVGCIIVGLIGPWALGLIESKVEILGAVPWMLLLFYFILERFNMFNLVVCGIGNNIVLFWRQAIAGLISLLGMIMLIPSYGALGAIIAMIGSTVLIMNWQPAVFGGRQTGAGAGFLVYHVLIPAIVVWFLGVVAATIIK